MKTAEYLKGLCEATLIHYENQCSAIDTDKGLTFECTYNLIVIGYISKLSSKWSRDHKVSFERITITESNTAKAICNDIWSALEKIDNVKL